MQIIEKIARARATVKNSQVQDKRPTSRKPCSDEPALRTVGVSTLYQRRRLREDCAGVVLALFEPKSSNFKSTA